MFRTLLASAVAVAIAAPAFAQTVNVYSSRQPDLIAPLLEAFTEQTGIKTQALFLNKGLVERVSAEGENSPADIILTVDVGNLDAADKADILQPVDSDVLTSQIPAAFRDDDNKWFGLTQRGRVIYASKDRVAENSISYEELAGDAFKGRLCTRSGQHVYNIGLFASLVAHNGAAKAEELIAGYKANMARQPQGNDRAQAKGIFSGECDVALGNSYYVGLMLTNEKETEQKDWAAAMKVIFPNNEGRGTHVNISGVGLAKHAPNKDAAILLMEYLASDEAQAIYAERVFEYPVSPNAAVSDIVAGFGEINKDSLSLSDIAANRKTASQIVDKVGYND